MILKTSKTVPDRLETAPPAIGKGGNWWAYDDKTGKFADTGVKAKGDKGDKGADGHTLSLSVTMTAPPIDDYGNGTVGMFKATVLYDGAEVTDGNLRIPSRCTLKDGKLSDWDKGEVIGHGDIDFVDSVFTVDYFYIEFKVTYKGLTAYDSIHYRISREGKLRAALDNANTLIEGLSTIRDEIRNGTVEPRKFKDIQYLLDALQKDGSFKTGILLSSVIALSGKDGDITSYLSGARGDGIAMLRAGVEHFGGADGNPETAQTTIWSDGSVDIGDMHFVNEKDPEADHIDFTDKAADHTYLQIGGAPKTESEIINAGTVIKEFKIVDTGVKETGTYRVDRFQSTESNREVKYTATVTAFARAVAEFVGTSTDGKNRYNGHSASASAYLFLKVYSGTSSTVKYSTQSATVSASASVSTFEIDRMTIPAADKMRQEDSASKTFTITAPGSYVATNDTVELSLVVSGSGSGDYETAQGSATDILNYLPYSNRKSLVSIMRDKVAFFFSRQKYLLFNYLSDYLVKIVGNVLVQGDLKADRIDTDNINGGLPVKVLAHGVWNKSGNYVRYTSADGGSISISRTGDGIYYLYFPATWDYTHLSFLGTANSLTDTGTINTGNVAFSKAERGRVKVFTGDDSSGNDSDVYFQIILRDFSN